MQSFKNFGKQAQLNEMRDEHNPLFLFSQTGDTMLMAVAKGGVDPKMIARATLANRGIGKSGRWVGHEAAEKEWGITPSERSLWKSWNHAAGGQYT